MKKISQEREIFNGWNGKDVTEDLNEEITDLKMTKQLLDTKASTKTFKIFFAIESHALILLRTDFY